ncbi:hypothetical protein EDC04DRAFT_3099891 [Pisolithus marmoratus]|nr:hypothetical protein EDC04DRAFT_3099891 [Pisolithus marmoratus]
MGHPLHATPTSTFLRVLTTLHGCQICTLRLMMTVTTVELRRHSLMMIAHSISEFLVTALRIDSESRPEPTPSPEFAAESFVNSCSSGVRQVIAQQELLLAIFHAELQRMILVMTNPSTTRVG